MGQKAEKGEPSQFANYANHVRGSVPQSFYATAVHWDGGGMDTGRGTGTCQGVEGVINKSSRSTSTPKYQ